MMIALLLTVFIISLVIGSFFNVLIDRIVRDEQFVSGRSYCESCKHELTTKDLIPLLSFIFQKGKCRYCGDKIPVSLPIGELSLAVLFTSVFYWFFYLSNFSGEYITIESLIFLIGTIFFYSMIHLIFYSDLKYQLIPEVFMYGLLTPYFVGLILYYFFGMDFAGYGILLYGNLISNFLAALSMFAFFGLLHIGFKGKAMGEGDIYLSSILAVYLGLLLTMVMWFTAFLTGAVIGVILILIASKGMKSKIAFGPFLVIGFLVAVLYGNQIANWYLSLL